MARQTSKQHHGAHVGFKPLGVHEDAQQDLFVGAGVDDAEVAFWGQPGGFGDAGGDGVDEGEDGEGGCAEVVGGDVGEGDEGVGERGRGVGGGLEEGEGEGLG